MKRGWVRAACIAALVAACFLVPRTAFAAEKSPSTEHVVLVLAPYLTWGDISETGTPNIWRLAETGAMGNLNARSRAEEGGGEPASPVESALAVSAGNWAQPDYGSNAAFNTTETYAPGSTAGEVYRRLSGISAGGSHLVYLGLPQMQRSNGSADNVVVLGTLGQALEDANGLLAAVGNSDATGTPAPAKLMRPAAVVAMDEQGLVRFGDVSEDLLRQAPDAPYGVTTDLEAFRAQVGRITGFARGHRGPSLIVLDPGDLYRARRFEPQTTPDVAARQHAEALTTLDEVVGVAIESAGSDGTVMLVSQAQSNDPGGYLAGVGPAVIAGPGWRGYLTSASTHRIGLVTNLDVTATILNVLGVPVPVQVVGDPIQAVLGPAAIAQRAAHLGAVNDAAISVDAPKAIVINSFIDGYLILLALAAIAIAFWRRWPARLTYPAVTVLKAAALLLLAVPVSTWLMFVFMPLPANASLSLTILAGTVALVWGMAALVWWKFGVRVPAMLVCSITALVLMVDQWLGAPLSFSNFFGYSPLMGARFYGMGNEAAGLLLGSSLIAVALTLDQWPDAAWLPAMRRYGVAALGLLVVVTAAAPFLGANVGVAIWGLVGYVVMWALVNGYRVTWKTALVAVGLIVLLIFAFAAIDLASREPTHLARSLTSAQQGGLTELWMIVARKAATNARVFATTNWSTVLVAALAFLGFARFLAAKAFADTLAENPAFGYAIVATLAAGTVAFFSEDSGIVIPALMMVYPALGLAWLMLCRITPWEARR